MNSSNRAEPERLPRPHQLQSLTPDQLVAVVLHLAMEISVLRDRLATHEALLDAGNVMPRETVESFAPDGDESARRTAARAELITALLDKLR